MGKAWDKSGIAFNVEFWQQCLRVLKPGGYLLAFSHARTYHRMTCAIEDAGFEVRDQIMWLYTSGVPKSHNVANDIDKSLGCPPRGKAIPLASTNLPNGKYAEQKLTGHKVEKYVARTEAGKPWEGHGTALKPAHEPICVARKPFEGPLYANVLEHGTGGLNIDETRVGTRWPANIIHDGLDEEWAPYFYSPKASKAEKAGSKHPTVKPLALMRYLVRLVTPAGGLVLDPFGGTGTTGIAANEEGMQAILIERDSNYVAHIKARAAG